MIARITKETDIRSSIDNLETGIIGKVFKDTKILITDKVQGTAFTEGDKTSDLWYQDQNGWYYWSKALKAEELAWDYKKKLVNVPAKWDTNHGKGSKIMVIDSGFDLSHPGLKHLNLAGHKFDVSLDDFNEQDGNTSVLFPFSEGSKDRNDHGNGVLSIISANPVLDFDVQGIANQSEIFLAKARDNSDFKEAEYYIRALELAAKLKVDIVTCSMSFNKPKVEEKARFDEVMKQLDKQKTIVLQALPNANKFLLKGENVKFPADNTDTLGVGMIKNDFYQDNVIQNNKKIGTHVDLLMPNTDLNLFNRKSATITRGSSFATPYFAGLIAIYLSINGGRDNIELSGTGTGLLRKFYLKRMKSYRAFTSFNTNQTNPYFFLPKHY